MNARHPLACLALAGVLPWISGRAADNPTPPSTDTTITATATSAQIRPTPRPRPRLLSARLNSVLAERLPRYIAAAPAAGTNASESPRPDTTDDLVLRLPKLVVHGPRPSVLTKRDVSTQRGLTEIAMWRYISQLDRVLNHFRLPLFSISCEDRALAMYAEDERLERMADLDRTVRAAALVDRAAAAELGRLAADTYAR